MYLVDSTKHNMYVAYSNVEYTFCVEIMCQKYMWSNCNFCVVVIL